MLERATFPRKGGVPLLFLIELKTSPFEEDHFAAPKPLLEAVLTLINRLGIADQTILQSFDGRVLHYLKEMAPHITFHALTETEWEPDSLWLRPYDHEENSENLSFRLHHHGAKAWSPPFKFKSAEYLRIEQQQQTMNHTLKTIVWTPNLRADLEKMVDLGVDGIITDRPDLLMEILKCREAQDQADQPPR